MRLVIQRVTSARVSVDGEVVGEIGSGLLVYAGFHKTDERSVIELLAKKLVALRIFGDEAGKMNLSVEQINAEILIVSQFTLYGDASKGNRPSYVEAAEPGRAEGMYGEFVEAVTQLIGEVRVKTGRFQAMMKVESVNDGPVTILMEKCQ